jgi:hypothetical protein
MGLIPTDRATQHAQPLRADGENQAVEEQRSKIMHLILMILLLMSNIILWNILSTYVVALLVQKNSPGRGY